MKHFLCLSFAALLLASCAEEVKEPAVKKPAPPPPTLIYHTGNSNSITSSLSGARIVVDSPYETGVVTYTGTAGCTKASFEAISFGSPMLVQITTRRCSDGVSSVYVPPFSWQYYEVGDLTLMGGAINFRVEASAAGSYGGAEIRNLRWY